MTSGYDNLARRIFGERWEELARGERAVVLEVLEWYEGKGVTEDARKETETVGAIWAAARDELGVTAYMLRSKSRARAYNDVRFCMYRLVNLHLPSIPKMHIGEVLGIKRNHASLLNALHRSDDLVESDPAFRALYKRMERRMQAYIEFAEGQRMQQK